MISLLTCSSNGSGEKKPRKSKVSRETKEILKKMDERVHALHAALPANAMFIVCTGHGDTSIVHRFVATQLKIFECFRETNSLQNLL